MMTGARISRTQAYTFALQGFALGMFLVFVAAIDFDFPGLVISALYVPAAAIYLWPYRADYGMSVVCALCIGLFQDIATQQPLGIFALSYTLLYALTNPAQQLMPKTKRANVAIFALWIAALISLTFVLGYLTRGHAPNILSLLVSGLISILMFCGLIWIRDYRTAFTGRADLRRSR